ncbi:MAG: lysine--tRNA ligase [Candidatus Pacearchaeota archaeon]
MARIDEIIKERLRKIEELKKLNIALYPYSFTRTNFASELQQSFSKLKPGEKSSVRASIAGRVMAIRLMGKINFATLQDGSGKIQAVIQEDAIGKEQLNFFIKYIDVGDIIGVSGYVIRTQRGELSILADRIEILSKALLPLPEKWHGLKDVEERYRKRYLDLIMNTNVREVFIQRAKIINAIREFLNARGFIEVETPLLQPIYGGARARPFITELHELHMKMYLSISPELYLKRLVVGGFEKVYTICKNFRNEGIDRSHNPEFTMLEAYCAYSDYNDMMALFEEIWVHVLRKLGKEEKEKLEYQGNLLNFKRPWQRLTVYDALKKYAGLDVKSMTDKELLEKANELRKEAKLEPIPRGTPRGLIIEELFKEVEDKLIQPTHIIDHPKETTPLCKEKRGDPELIERSEPYVAGLEVGNIYSELNDPILQKKLLEEQAAFLKKQGFVHPIDKDFIEAISYGMPPCGGLGLGIDRMVMILTNQPSIRDVILFPFMKQL